MGFISSVTLPQSFFYPPGGAPIPTLVPGGGRFHDNGDGTITDRETGLMWEKKTDEANLFTWSNSGTVPDGTLFTTFLASLSAGSGFAGHTDWRVPTIEELETIIEYSAINPSVSAAFNSWCTLGCSVETCSCTVSTEHWSSTSFAGDPRLAWVVDFSDGEVRLGPKAVGATARGVRGGS